MAKPIFVRAQGLLLAAIKLAVMIIIVSLTVATVVEKCLGVMMPVWVITIVSHTVTIVVPKLTEVVGVPAAKITIVLLIVATAVIPLNLSAGMLALPITTVLLIAETTASKKSKGSHQNIGRLFGVAVRDAPGFTASRAVKIDNSYYSVGAKPRRRVFSVTVRGSINCFK